MEFFNSIQSVISIFLIIGLGYYLEYRKWLDDNFGETISAIITKIALPASIFVSVVTNLDTDNLLSLSGSLVLPAISTIVLYLIGWLLAAALNISQKRRGVFINGIANSNMVFIGLPLSVALFGNKGLPFYLLCYIINTLSTWTLGIYLISRDNPAHLDERAEMKINLKRLLPPPLVGFLSAVAVLFIGIDIPVFVEDTFTYVGNLVAPLSLMYIGIMLRKSGLKHIRFNKDMSVPLVCRFIVSPAVTFTMLAICTEVIGMNLHVMLKEMLWIQASTPMLVVLPILAAEYNADSEYATDLVTTSTVMFIVILPIMINLMNVFY